ncbi:GrBNV gp39-like protein [Tomelloso virus]|uniref:GrBNV gp39-like protein n=1 Tax=Tomelloso virus TaxID=2053981 RepID=A0A2H4T2S7_9VIRU|nr:GrBNV gp39-like protein [Tomelloso virus]ATY70227.1 GrBNV gp39-like protein [Tomelloso virus]
MLDSLRLRVKHLIVWLSKAIANIRSPSYFSSYTYSSSAVILCGSTGLASIGKFGTIVLIITELQIGLFCGLIDCICSIFGIRSLAVNGQLSSSGKRKYGIRLATCRFGAFRLIENIFYYRDVMENSPQYTGHSDNDDYNFIPQSPDYTAPTSPLYEPTTPPHYENMDFSSTCSQSYTRETENRKRIYGEEYKEPTVLNILPKCKIIKLEHPENEKLDLDSKVLPMANKQQPYPSPTERQYNMIELHLADLPEMCMSCYSFHCICSVIKKNIP